MCRTLLVLIPGVPGQLVDLKEIDAAYKVARENGGIVMTLKLCLN